MPVNNSDSRKPNPRYKLLKRAAEEQGLPYTSLRDAYFRGELPVVKLGGGNEKYQRWYVDVDDLRRWIEGRKALCTA